MRSARIGTISALCHNRSAHRRIERAHDGTDPHGYHPSTNRDVHPLPHGHRGSSNRVRDIYARADLYQETDRYPDKKAGSGLPPVRTPS